MRLRTRIVLAFSAILVTGAVLLVRTILEDVKPRYREAVEESLNDTAALLAGLAARDADASGLRLDALRATLGEALAKRFEARIYGLRKTRVDLRVYVTDDRGIVRYDSDGGRAEGQDYSDKNDVWLTLRGRYGARTTRAVEDDPRTSAMYVAAPVVAGGRLVGVLTVVKPADAVLLFMHAARTRLTGAVGLAVLGLVLLVGGVTLWISRPLERLTVHARAVAAGSRAPVPAPGGAAELRELADALEQMRKALEGKAYVERYVQALTHEMKSPLSAVSGAAELLSEDMPPADRERFLGNIRSEVARLRDLVERMLLLASLESRTGLQDPEELAPAAVAAEVVQSLQPRAAALGVALELGPTEGAAPTVLAERFLLRQALANLVDNALDFTPRGGRVTVTVAATPDAVTLAVADTGLGVPDYALPRVFERFYSLERPGTGRKGTGLGLAFVREVAELHGGGATLTNQPSGGARSALTLPLPTGAPRTGA